MYQVTHNHDDNNNITTKCEPVNDDTKRCLIDPIKRIIDSFPVWQPFIFDDDGSLCGSIPDYDEEVLISDGYNIIIDMLTCDEDGYYLDGSNWDLEKLAWMPMPKPYKKHQENSFEDGNIKNHHESTESQKAKPQNFEVKTKSGRIMVTECQDPDYPGVDVEFIPDDKDGESVSNSRVLIEEPIDGNLQAFVWSDRSSEDFTHKIDFSESMKEKC